MIFFKIFLEKKEGKEIVAINKSNGLFYLFYLFYLFINEVFCSNPVQQDESLIFTVQERNIYIVINLIYEMNN